MTELFVPKTPHYNMRRPTMLIIHGIAVSYEDATDMFLGKTLEASMPYYITQDGKVEQYLDETVRAWQVGVSYWAGFTDLNSISLGIELQGAPIIEDEKDFDIIHYTKEQMKTLADLSKDICERHKILPHHVLGHQDIAPYRKFDPGKNLDWAGLAQEGVGLWHGLEPLKDDPVIKNDNQIALFKNNLTLFGYDPRVNKDGKDYSQVIHAFQKHFLPWNICGEVTDQSVQAINILLQMKFS